MVPEWGAPRAPSLGFRVEGAPDSSIRCALAPGTVIRTDHDAQLPSLCRLSADGTALRCRSVEHALECFVVTTLSHPYPCVISVYGRSAFGSRQGARCSSVSLYFHNCKICQQSTFGYVRLFSILLTGWEKRKRYVCS